MAQQQNTPQRRNTILVAIVVLVALAAGVLIGKTLLRGHAAIRTTAISQTKDYGRLQEQQRVRSAYPFFGPFHLHQCGPAIRLMEGALRHLQLPIRHTPAAACYGKATAHQVAAFQRRIHYKPTGVYNLATHLVLVKRHGYSRRSRRDLLYLVRVEVAKKHADLVALQRRTVIRVAAHARLVGGSTLAYSQSSSRSYFPPWPRIPPATDCSGFVTWILYEAGVGYRVGFPPNVGWTGSMVYRGIPVSLNAKLQPGDELFYGYAPTYGHVAMYIGHGLVVSHGSVGVKYLPYNYRPVGAIRRVIW